MSVMNLRKRPLIIAHRGNSSECPENTFEAFESALAYGADGIELDIQETRDGEIVVYHDRTLEKICGPRKPITTQNVRDIQSLDAGGWKNLKSKGRVIPTLRNTFKNCRDKTEWLV